MTLSVGCGSETPTEPGGGGSTPPPPPPTGGGLLLASGEFDLPGAILEGDPGYHEVLIALHTLRPDLAGTSGRRLVVSLRDATRPSIGCLSDEPEEGCAAVDWSDDPAGPRVPPDGVFINRLRIELSSGPRELYLSRDFRLATVPDLVDPNHRHTAVGGGGREWSLVLPAHLEAGSDLELRLVMTKWQPPNVRIAYEVRVLEGS